VGGGGGGRGSGGDGIKSGGFRFCISAASNGGWAAASIHGHVGEVSDGVGCTRPHGKCTLLVLVERRVD